jgi:hypothetical protein
VFSLLAAFGPGLQVMGWFRARRLIRTITQYGPLPEIHIPLVDYIVLTSAIVLILAAILDIVGLKIAAPIILSGSIWLWILVYAPGVWELLTGDMTWLLSSQAR